MKYSQIQQFVTRYLETTGSQIIEKSPSHVTVKLSPEADRDLTNRSYYWSFIERTGAEPETMSFTFVFDPQAIQAAKEAEEKKKAQARTSLQQAVSPDGKESILGRYFGYIPPVAASGRVLNENVTYGCRRLDQIFSAVRKKGQFVCLFEEPAKQHVPGQGSASYTSWFGVNFKIEFICDMKRDELHSLGISLSTGEIVKNFQQQLQQKKLTPRLPAHIHLREAISLRSALAQLENYLDRHLDHIDPAWAVEAKDRLDGELLRIEGYYGDLIAAAEEENIKSDVEQQFNNRKQEIEWQYQPRIEVSVINCGLFHLEEPVLHQF